MTIRLRLVRASTLTTLVLATPFLTSCTFYDGDQLADDINTWMAGLSGIKDVEARSSENLPGLGSIDVTIVLDGDADIKEADSALARIADFPDFGGVTGLSFQIEGADFFGEVEVSLDVDLAGDHDRIALLLDVANWGTVTTFTLTHYAGESPAKDWIEATTTADVFATLDRLAEASSSLPISFFDLEDTTKASSIHVDDLAEAAAPRAIYDAIDESFTIMTFAYSFDEMTVRVAGAPNDDVAAIAAAVAPGMAFTVQFGNVTRDGDVEFLQPAIDAVNATGVMASVYVSETAFSVSVVGSVDAFAVDEALLGVDLGGAILVYWVIPPDRAGLSPEDVVLLRGVTPGETLAAFRLLLDAIEHGPLAGAGLEYGLRESGMEVRGSPDELTDEQVRALAAGLRDALPTGTPVSIVGGPLMKFTADGDLTLEDADVDFVPEGAEGFAATFVDAWNAAG